MGATASVIPTEGTDSTETEHSDDDEHMFYSKLKHIRLTAFETVFCRESVKSALKYDYKKVRIAYRHLCKRVPELPQFPSDFFKVHIVAQLLDLGLP